MGLFALWLVFTMVRKLFGVILLAALAGGAWIVWNNPQLLDRVWTAFGAG